MISARAHSRIRGSVSRAWIAAGLAAAALCPAQAFGAPAPACRAQSVPAAARDLAGCVPSEAVLFADAPGLAAFAERAAADPWVASLASSPVLKALWTRFRSEQVEGWKYTEHVLAGALPEALAPVCRGGLALALLPRAGKPAVLLLLRAESTAAATGLRERGLAEIGRRFGVEKLLAKPHAERAGAALWYLGEDVCIAQRGALLLGSNDRKRVGEALDLEAAPAPGGLLARADFAEARAQRADDLLAWSWIDLARADSIAQDGGAGLAKLRSAARNPTAVMALGPVLASLGTGRSLAFELALRGAALELRASGAGVALPAALLPSASEAALPPALAEAGDCAQAQLYRDWASVYAQRSALFDTEHLPALAKGASDLALLFSGKDFAEDVLPRISPWWRLVAAPASYDEGQTPGIALPALAAVFELRDAKTDGALFLTAFQSAIGIANIERAQKGEPALLLSLSLEGQVPVTAAKLPSVMNGDAVDFAYNLAPACAQVGARLVIGTHESLVKRLVRALAAGAPAPARASRARATDELQLFGTELAHYVERNRDALVLNAVLEDGKSEEQARGEIDVLAELLRLLHSATLQSSNTGDAAELRLRLDFARTEPGAGTAEPER